MIITQVARAIVHYVDLKQDAKTILATPRFHHQWRPDKLFLETKHSPKIEKQLRESGHNTQRRNASVMQAITRSADGKMFHGASDPRVPGKAAGF